MGEGGCVPPQRPAQLAQREHMLASSRHSRRWPSGRGAMPSRPRQHLESNGVVPILAVYSEISIRDRTQEITRLRRQGGPIRSGHRTCVRDLAEHGGGVPGALRARRDHLAAAARVRRRGGVGEAAVSRWAPAGVGPAGAALGVGARQSCSGTSRRCSGRSTGRLSRRGPSTPNCATSASATSRRSASG